MKNFILFITTLVLCVYLISCNGAEQNNQNLSDLPVELKDLEYKAEAGDTAAMHRLIEFYADNTPVCIEVVEAIDPYGNPIDIDTSADSQIDNTESDLYKDRLEYWLTKGISMNDPVAYAEKGYQLYYTDEKNAMIYLAKAVDMGNTDAALFCGSACYNQGKYDDTFKYFTQAYNQGAQSAGWYLAMCYAKGLGTQVNRSKAIECLRHAANLNYPEAVLEMKRIEPENPVWTQKADSLEIDFPAFPIIESINDNPHKNPRKKENLGVTHA